jgi:hypothetical protein
MIHIDFSSKRAKLALRFFTYGVMTVATIVLSIILIFFALGYRLDRNFNFSQGGLLQFESFPDNASITVDSKKQSFKTPNKLNIGAGEHTISYELEGYQSWAKKVQIGAGQLLWLNYARLIPSNIETNNIRQFESLYAVLPSPDRHWLLMQEKAEVSQLVLVDISNEKEPKYTTLSIPENQLTKKEGVPSSFRLVEWELGARYFLIEHQIGDVREYIRMDRTKPNEAINISKQFGFAIAEAHFSGSNPNQMFVNTDSVLRRLDLGSTSATGALVNNVKQFVVYGGGTIAFTNESNENGERQQKIGIWKDDKTTIVRTVPQERQVILAYSEYDDHKYLAFGSADSARVEILRDPGQTNAIEANQVFTTLEVGAPLQSLQFNNTGRMLIAQHDAQFATYDIEEAKGYQTTLPLNVTKPLRWLDDFYLWTDVGDKLTILEFDGQNMHEITSVGPGYGVTLSENGKRLFSVGKDASGALHLQASRLTTEE